MTKKKKKAVKRIAIRLALLCFCLGAVVMIKHNITAESSPLDWMYHLFPAKEGVLLDDAYGVPIYTDLLEAGSDRRPGIKRRLAYIVIHETGNDGIGADAQSHSNYLHSAVQEGEEKTSWHYTVDDGEIYHHIPDDEIAYHAGTRANQNGIGIELCVDAGSDFEKTFDNGAKLVGRLMVAYDLTIEDVKQHAQFMQKNCPQRIRESGRWEEFLQKAQQYAENGA